MNAAIDEAAGDAGRQPEEIRRLFNINGSFDTGSGFLQGTPERWAEQLTQLTLTTGMSTYILSVSSADDLRRFAEEVAPATRDRVAAARGAPEAEPPAGPVVVESPAPLAARPTPVPVPLSGERVWDETTRPTGPRPTRPAPTPRTSRPPAGTSSTSMTRCARSSLSCAIWWNRLRPAPPIRPP